MAWPEMRYARMWTFMVTALRSHAPLPPYPLVHRKNRDTGSQHLVGSQWSLPKQCRSRSGNTQHCLVDRTRCPFAAWWTWAAQWHWPSPQALCYCLVCRIWKCGRMWVAGSAHHVSWRRRWCAKEYCAYQTNRSGSCGISSASISPPSPGPTILMFHLAYRVVLQGLGLDVWNVKCALSVLECCLLLGSLWTTICPSRLRLYSPFLQLVPSPIPMVQNAETHTDHKCRYANEAFLGSLSANVRQWSAMVELWQTWICKWSIKGFMLSNRVTNTPPIKCRIVLAKYGALQRNIVN